MNEPAANSPHNPLMCDARFPDDFHRPGEIGLFRYCKNKAVYAYQPTQAEPQYLCGTHARSVKDSPYLRKLT